MKSSLFLWLVAGALILPVCFQFSSGDSPCRRQTGCMCETDNFTIDISNTFDYPVTFNVTYGYDFSRVFRITFDCHGMDNCYSEPYDENVAICQYMPDQDKYFNWGKATEVTWTLTSHDHFSVLYGKEIPASAHEKGRISEIDFFIMLDDPDPANLYYKFEDDEHTYFVKYIFEATIPEHRIQPTPSPTPTPTPIPPSPTPSPPSPAPPSPHCYSNYQLVMIIGVSSAVAIAVFTLMVATIVAVVIWLCGKGRQPKKPKFQYTQLEKPQAL